MLGSIRRARWISLVLAAIILGCAMPPPAILPLSAGEARHTLDNWNPKHSKVVEFYGFYAPGGDVRVAYVLLSNPGDPATKPVNFEATFHLLTRPDGKQQWFLVSLLSHARGLSLRRGWDNLMVPVKPEPPAAGQ